MINSLRLSSLLSKSEAPDSTLDIDKIELNVLIKLSVSLIASSNDFLYSSKLGFDIKVISRFVLILFRGVLRS